MTISYKNVREHNTLRLAGLFIKILYKLQFKLYISDVGGRYKPVYSDSLNFDQVSYQGSFAFIMLKGGEHVLCMLHSTFHPCIYNITEVPMAYSRMPGRELQIEARRILCVLIPCC